MRIEIDGKEVAARPGQTILEAARANGIRIPTLCHNPALEPAAMCRLCTVEISEGHRARLVTACNYPLRRDAKIHTQTDNIRMGRKLIIELLYARCPTSTVLKGLAEEYGADLNRFPADDVECVMCGLCARVCERVGGNCLTLSGRGVEIKVDTAFGRPSESCIACGACAQICPVDAIRIEDSEGVRRVIIHGKVASAIPLRHCTSCGKHFGPVIDLNKVMEMAGEPAVPPPNASVCPECSRRNLAKRLMERHSEQYDLDRLETGEEA